MSWDLTQRTREVRHPGAVMVLQFKNKSKVNGRGQECPPLYTGREAGSSPGLVPGRNDKELRGDFRGCCRIGLPGSADVRRPTGNTRFARFDSGWPTGT